MPNVGSPGAAAVGGPFATTDYIDWPVSVTVANSGTIPQGSAIFRDNTQISGAPGNVGPDGSPNPSNNSDIGILGNSANASSTSPIIGIYQGPTITNSTGASQTYTIYVRKRGYGLVLATAKTAGTAVVVGGTLIGEPGTDQFVLQGAFAYGKTIGIATATGAVVTNGATIIAVPGSGQTNTLINAHINCV